MPYIATGNTSLSCIRTSPNLAPEREDHDAAGRAELSGPRAVEHPASGLDGLHILCRRNTTLGAYVQVASSSSFVFVLFPMLQIALAQSSSVPVAGNVHCATAWISLSR